MPAPCVFLFSVLVLILQRCDKLSFRDLADGNGNGLVRQRLVRDLRLDGKLTRAARDHVHEQIAAVDMLHQTGHCGIKH